MQRTIYHGSEAIIKQPAYGVGKQNNDYGLGFYCTTVKTFANEWAIRFGKDGFVNKYTLRDDSLKILDLTKPPYNDVITWVALLMANRKVFEDLKLFYPRELAYLNNRLVDVTQYDIVIGYRADDAYFHFPESFVRSELTLESLDRIFQAGELGKQYVLVSELAFKKLKFIEAEPVKAPGQNSYAIRVANASKLHQELLAKDRYAKGTRLIDLVRD